MKIISSLAVCLMAVLVSDTASFAKEWRGIVPLHATRADVERLLGSPKQSTPYASYYSLPDEIAVVWFQAESCDSNLGKFGFGWNVPAGTVTEIGVIPKANYRKEKFVAGDKFKVQDANAGFFYYTDESEGLSVETFHGIVTSIDYTPTEKEGDRRCPRTQECCVDFFPRVDEYGALSYEDEKARLDNYAILMKERLNRGVIVAYGRSHIERAKIMKRAKRAKKYLTLKHGVEPQRILVVDGGYREHSATELNLHTIGGAVSRVYLFPAPDPKARSVGRL
jgi:hypothetical protein